MYDNCYDSQPHHIYTLYFNHQILTTSNMSTHSNPSILINLHFFRSNPSYSIKSTRYKLYVNHSKP